MLDWDVEYTLMESTESVFSDCYGYEKQNKYAKCNTSKWTDSCFDWNVTFIKIYTHSSCICGTNATATATTQRYRNHTIDVRQQQRNTDTFTNVKHKTVLLPLGINTVLAM